MSVYGYDRKTTPYLDSLRSSTVVFENAFSLGPSSASMSGTLTSTVPLTRGAYYSIPDALPTISEALPDAYTCLGVHSHGYFVSEGGFAKGFDKYRQLDMAGGRTEGINLASTAKASVKRILPESSRAYSVAQSAYRTLKEAVATPSDPRVNGQQAVEVGLNLLERHSQPVFMWIHLMDTHSPYIPDMDILSEFNPNLTERDISKLIVYRNANDKVEYEDDRTQALIDVYDAEIRRTDAILRSFIEGVRSMPSLDSPAIIISADHGEAFGEHGWIGHPPEALYDETLHIPLLVKDPERSSATKSRVVSSLDLGPTICDLTDTEPPDSFQGVSLFSSSENEPTAAVSLATHDRQSELRRENLGIRHRTEEWAYIYRETAPDELYRVSESENIAESEPEMVAEFRDQINPIKEALDYGDEGGLRVSTANKQRLKQLGYLKD